ncbi:MAG TPA: histidine--tRNA ligase [Rhizomicrobium sp.]|nr:histidine--tRNA ligase [Rhizomicrobium sp.]
MSKEKPSRPKARLPRGFRDRTAGEIAAERAALDTIRRVYESYGFSPLETPAFEYTDALGKFLPDLDRPNEGVFSLKDDDDQWLSLRYDLTAPLARYVAENFQNLPKPFRRYQVGSVWRNEKPGPGRYREFTQFDADTVGSNSPAADAELLMMLADTLTVLGLNQNECVIKLNNRKVLDGVLEAAGISLEDSERRGRVLRAIDKFDRLGAGGVRDLLGSGRKDESGDFTRGAELEPLQVDRIISFVSQTQVAASSFGAFRESLNALVGDSEVGKQGFDEIEEICRLVSRPLSTLVPISFDGSVIRGLDYYTGPVFEAQLTFPVKNDTGAEVIFGSVAGGGRYDDLVARFTGQQVPATGVSIGVSRLMSALIQRGIAGGELQPLVVILAIDDVSRSFEMARELRSAGVRAEAYVGTKKFGDQLKYADKRGASIAVIEGSDELAKGEVVLKNLALGAELAKNIESRADWVKDRPAQISVKRGDLVKEVRAMLAGVAS